MSQTTDPLMQMLRDIEDEASRSANWTHYKGWNDLKTTFNDALAICEEVREKAEMCKHAETKELPVYAKSYVVEKIYNIIRAMGLQAKIQDSE